MIGAGDIIAQGLGGVAAQEDRSGMTHPGQHQIGFGHGQFQMFRGESVDQGRGFAHQIAHHKPPLAPDNPWGFTIKQPPLEFNLGELYNLSVRAGTLTAEERYHISDHMVQTIIMLESLPFPRSLKRVPEWAGGHHEKLDGTGYPKGLTKEQMSIPARAMAIADIFEALTARDRPYKTPKKLSDCIKILSFMKKDRHIDGDVFDLLLKSGVLNEYATNYLLADQIDEVDLDKYLPKAS